MKIGPWQLIEGGCGATRVRIGGDVNNIDDRYAFIEKTPRLRIREAYYTEHLGRTNDYLNWAAREFKGNGPNDQESRDWCDAALKLFGYELEDEQAA